MKVILLKDVKNVGKKDQIVEVSDGYAANFLFPRKLAIKMTSKGIEVLNDQQEEKRQEEQKKKEQALKDKEVIENLVLEFTATSSKDGRMFGTISPKQIELEIKKHGINVDKRKFVEKYPVNAFGYTNLKIELYKDVIAQVRVHVTEKQK